MKHLERLPREIQLDDQSESGTRAVASLTNVVTPMHWAERQERMEQVRAAVLELPSEFELRGSFAAHRLPDRNHPLAPPSWPGLVARQA
jgi:hypothetical protein